MSGCRITPVWTGRENGGNMGRALACILAVCLLAGGAGAETYTFQSRDSGGIRSDFEDLDHTKAYLWAFKWQPAANEVITGASLTFSNIYNNDNLANWLGVWLIADKPTTGGTTGWSGWSSDTFSGLTLDTAVYQKGDNQNVAKPFDAVANKALLGAYSDTKPGSTVKETVVFDFASPALKSYSTPTWGWAIYDDAPLQTSLIDELTTWSADGTWALGIDPDCHFYNDGVTLTIMTKQIPSSPPPVPEPMCIVLGALGLASVMGLRRFRA